MNRGMHILLNVTGGNVIMKFIVFALIICTALLMAGCADLSGMASTAN